jgi:hypothetical protein
VPLCKKIGILTVHCVNPLITIVFLGAIDTTMVKNSCGIEIPLLTDRFEITRCPEYTSASQYIFTAR